MLTSTAIVMQILEERGEIDQPQGRRIVSILLLEDLGDRAAAGAGRLPRAGRRGGTLGDRLRAVAIGLAAIAALVAAGRWLLNPLFRLLAAARAREVMTAAALLVVLGRGAR